MTTSYDFSLVKQSLHYAVESDNMVAVDLLLEVMRRRKAKGYINRQRERTGTTVLHESCKRGKLEMVKKLVQAGASLTRRDKMVRNVADATNLVY